MTYFSRVPLCQNIHLCSLGLSFLLYVYDFCFNKSLNQPIKMTPEANNPHIYLSFTSTSFRQTLPRFAALCAYDIDFMQRHVYNLNPYSTLLFL